MGVSCRRWRERRSATPKEHVADRCAPLLSVLGQPGERALREHGRPGCHAPTLILTTPSRRPCASVLDGGDYRRMFTARATTITASVRLIADCTSISIFAQRLSGIASVGLNAVAFVNDT